MAAIAVTTATPVQIPVSGEVLIQNIGTGVLYVGAKNVSIANGIKVAVGASITVPAGYGSLWAIAETSDADCRYFPG